MLGVRVSEKVQEMIAKENETLVLLTVSRMKATCKAQAYLFGIPAPLLCFRFFPRDSSQQGCLAEITGFSRKSSPTFIVSNEESPLPGEEVNPNLADKIMVEGYY